METIQEDTIRQLNELIEVCKDSEEGYRKASENVRNTELESMFKNYAKQRGAFTGELQAEVDRLGGKATDSGSFGGALHRGWMEVKSALSGGDSAAIISACESGEASAEAAYARALGTHISGKSGSLIEKQSQQIKEAHTRLRRLKGEMEDGTRFPSNE